jgi:hypothetical protein
VRYELRRKKVFTIETDYPLSHMSWGRKQVFAIETESVFYNIRNEAEDTVHHRERENVKRPACEFARYRLQGLDDRLQDCSLNAR